MHKMACGAIFQMFNITNRFLFIFPLRKHQLKIDFEGVRACRPSTTYTLLIILWLSWWKHQRNTSYFVTMNSHHKKANYSSPHCKSQSEHREFSNPVPMYFWVASTDATHIFVWNWGSKMAAFPVMVPDFFVV